MTNKPEARAYYGVMHELFEQKAEQQISDEANEKLADAGIRVQEMIENLCISVSIHRI